MNLIARLGKLLERQGTGEVGLHRGPSRRRDLPSPDVSIIIPAFNHIDLTLRCLDSLARHESRWSFEVVVVDDGSTDETEQSLRPLDWIEYVRMPSNQGFTAACNAGGSAACGDYLVFLNNDATVCDGWLDALRGTFEYWDDAGLVGSKLVLTDGTMQECGGLIFRDGSAANFRRGDSPDLPHNCYCFETDYVSGAAMMIPRDLHQKLGGFDSAFSPAYYEDVDLAFRVRQAGFRVLANGQARINHIEGGTAGTDVTVGVKRYQTINHRIFFERWSSVLATHPERSPDADPSDRYCGSRILVVDWIVPRPDKDAGSVRMHKILRLLREMNCSVTFAARDLSYDPEYARWLEVAGIQVLRRPHTSSLESHLREHGEDYDSVIVSRRDTAAMHMDSLSQYCKNARIIFDTVDLHFLREERLQREIPQPKMEKYFAEQKVLELDLIRKANTTLVVSPAEREILSSSY